jgi:cell division transport system permease protein
MSAWLRAHADAARRAMRRLARDPWGTVMSVVVIASAVALPLFLLTLVESAANAASRMAADPVANVYFKAGADEAAARALEKTLRSRPGIKSVRFIAKDQALADMRRVGHLADLMASLETNPLPHTLTLQLENRDAQEMAALKTFLAAQPAVEDVAMDFEWADKIRRASALLERLALGVSLLLGVAILFVIGNTTRLQILSQRDEIEVCRLIGASRGYVRRPLLYQGALQGALAGLVAGLATFGASRWMAGEVRQLTASYGGWEMTTLSIEALAAAVVLTAILGWLGAWVSSSRHLLTVD